MADAVGFGNSSSFSDLIIEVSVGAQAPRFVGGNPDRFTAAPAMIAESKTSANVEKKVSAALRKADRDLAKEIVQHERDNRFTPPTLITPIEESFGKIDFDPCWHPDSAVRPLQYLDVREGHDGLRDPWKGRMALVNPPFSNRAAWVRRSYEVWRDGAVELVILITPAATSDPYFNDVIARHAHIFTVSGRPHFFKTDRTSQQTSYHIMITVLGSSVRQRMEFANRVRGTWWRPEMPTLPAHLT